ncbi:MAG TPA: LacI family transcriptional regulator [Rhodobacteraceae bacterium]|jgi:deoxyribonucleoside regulator|nr:LacI family transcriptional regulator [Paracoccaceae bacterium]|tara:strand:+ start:710 stop:1708 length:999 start_codon:yes stop_codon:yes gene_type:complete
MTDTSSIHQTDNTIIERHNSSIDPSREMRVRAAWLYYVEGLTQQATAKLLKINRVQVTRLLAEARKRGEVDIRINASISSIIEVERAVEHAFGIAKVIIAPMASEELDPTKAIASIAGQFISNYVQSDMKIGVGWGRTLYSTLPHIRGSDLEKIRVISLLGGISQAKRFNPAEFAWQFTELFNGEGYLVPAPALVDSAETKHALLEHCGINQIFELADDLDVAFLSAGGIEGITTSYRLGHVSEAERQSLIAAGAVGDLLYNFISEDGDLVDHNVNTRVISIGIDRLKNAKDRILISGGKEKVKVLLGCLRLVKPTVFITDEITAKAILSLK